MSTITQNSLWKFYDECSAFIDITNVPAKSKRIFNFKDNCHQMFQIPKLKPVRLDNINIANLDVATHKLHQYARDFDGRINRLFEVKNISWISHTTVVAITVAINLYILQTQKNKKMTKKAIDNPAPTRAPPRRFYKFLAKSRKD